MQAPLQEFASTLRTVIGWIYVFAALLWLGALAFAVYRVYQMRTLVPVQAEVLRADTRSYAETRQEWEDDWPRDRVVESFVPELTVRYQFEGKTITAEARYDSSGFRSIAERVVRRWKPGSRITVHIDPARPQKPLPGLGLNFATFQFSFVLVFAGCCFAGFAYGVGRLARFLGRSIA